MSLRADDPLLPRGTDKCRCTVCGEYFKSTAAFSKHRVGPYAPIGQSETRRCLSVAEMLARGMVQIASGHWVTRARADSTIPRPRNSGDRSEALPEGGSPALPVEMAKSATPGATLA